MRPTPTTRFHIDPFRRLRHPSRYVPRSIEVPTAHLPRPLTAPANRGIDCSKAAVEHSALTLALAVAGASSADSVCRARRNARDAWESAAVAQQDPLGSALAPARRQYSTGSPRLARARAARLSRRRVPSRHAAVVLHERAGRVGRWKLNGHHVRRTRAFTRRSRAPCAAPNGHRRPRCTLWDRVIASQPRNRAGRRSSSRPAAPACLRTPRRSGAQTQTVTCALCTSSAPRPSASPALSDREQRLSEESRLEPPADPRCP